ncbi:uncharacterized protein LOC124374476 [Homalodisca vitripennis]|uniref:uncharacterized protein LOC124374476 n=1 Tax=Homalodisca vitripennis TaxID=197043 RepID=UPI001EECA570|nr:uncharacterized protein LOC124374476 [Homalodisca vitripennis]
MSKADVECVTADSLVWRCQPCGSERRKSMRFESQSLEGKLTLEDIMKKILEMEQELLEGRIEEQEQYSRRNTVEIYGVPQEKNEDVVSVVKEVGKALDMDITRSMIDACHRLGNKSGPNNLPPRIIVKFVSRLDKEEFLRKRRVKSSFSTRHMNLGVDQPVYINESLTLTRRKLLGEARRLKREKNYKFLWVRNGKIFLRREESARVVHVTCQADLSKV